MLSLGWWKIDDNTRIINLASRLLPVRNIDITLAGIIDGDWLKELFAILQESPSVIRGYPSRLCDVAGVLYGLGQKIPLVLGVICTGENLFDFQRQILGEVFNASVIEEYGC